MLERTERKAYFSKKGEKYATRCLKNSKIAIQLIWAFYFHVKDSIGIIQLQFFLIAEYPS